MTKKTKDIQEHVKKETVIIVAVIMFATGFLSGVLLTAYKSSSGIPSEVAAPHQYQQMPSERQGDVSEELAVKIFELEKQLAENPSDFDQWIILGNLYSDTNNYEKAIIAYKKYLEKNPKNVDVLNNLGIMYRRSGRPDEAVSAFDTVLETHSSNERALFNKGVVLMHDLNDIEGAVKVWTKLVEINPDAISPGGMPVSNLIKRFNSVRP